MTKKQEENIKKMSFLGSIICYGLSSYLLGGFGGSEEDTDIQILTKNTQDIIQYSSKKVETGSIIASKTGKKYYFPWCSGVNRIKEENRIFFESEIIAQERGLTLSKTCD